MISKYWSPYTVNVHQDTLEGSLKHRLLDFNPKMSDLVGPGWGLRMCISITFSSSAATVVSGTNSENHCPRGHLFCRGFLETKDRVSEFSFLTYDRSRTIFRMHLHFQFLAKTLC